MDLEAIPLEGYPSWEMILSQIDNFDSHPYAMIHLEIFTFVRQKRQATLRPPRGILPIPK